MTKKNCGMPLEKIQGPWKFILKSPPPRTKFCSASLLLGFFFIFQREEIFTQKLISMEYIDTIAIHTSVKAYFHSFFLSLNLKWNFSIFFFWKSFTWSQIFFVFKSSLLSMYITSYWILFLVKFFFLLLSWCSIFSRRKRSKMSLFSKYIC